MTDKKIYAIQTSLNEICYENGSSISGARTEKPFCVILYGDMTQEQAKKMAETLEGLYSHV